MKIGLYPMVADVIHAGHMLAIEEAKSKCDYLVVALHCNPKYKTPVQTVYERYMQLRGIKWIDEIIPYNNKDDFEQMILSFPYDVYILGEDYKGRDWECSDIIKSLKPIEYLSRQHAMSSTSLKSRILNQHE